ncbi:hypothetical protein [Salipaludibacillus aurantiacus]|uniref:Uncharacterized protein n=1 Tax=Salipaludibacillus aurantiacus TaxID=1601833 RepID=A0A1H9RJV2_9BACI|nr:hypothetical protein [Salipaludibacillus aurantiacus]SER72848.1 hypothetical protein SAMN05518684_103190 [Salipaludibacillus aurantiacus]
MRSGFNHEKFTAAESRLMNPDLHRFSEAEQGENLFESVSENGLSIRDARALKKKLERN